MDDKEGTKNSPFLDKGSPQSHEEKKPLKKPGLFYQLFGCCLDRSQISGHLADSQSEDEKTKDQIDDTFDIKNQEKDQPYLQFNSQENNTDQEDYFKTKKKKEFVGINRDTNTYSANSLNSGLQGSLIDFRSSSLSKKTHNYDFDVSNFQVNQLFLCGKILQIIVLVKEIKHEIDYSQFAIPDEISSNSSTTSFSSISNYQSCMPYQFHPDTIKYYRRRLVYFSKYQNGILVENKSWQHLIPKQVVIHIAKRAASSSRRESIIVSENSTGQFTLAFAAHINQVISIETDTQRLNFTKHNSTIYNIPYCQYNQADRLSLNEGILFFSDSNFLSESFQVNSNLSDCVFIAPSLWEESLDNIPPFSPTYFQSIEFYIKLKQYLIKSFKLAPQVILLLPRSVKIIDICDCFTDSLKENPNTVKRCSVEIEKHFLNDHLKYICFYLGDFNRTQLSYKDEFSFINLQLEMCRGTYKQEPLEKRIPAHIHQSIFNDLGKFQILNIVIKFSYQVKMDKSFKVDKSLLSLFYAYLVSHGFLTQEKVSYILSRDISSNSNIISNLPLNFNATNDEKGNSNDEMMIKEYQSSLSYSNIKAFKHKQSQSGNGDVDDVTLSDLSRITINKKIKKLKRGTFKEDQAVRSRSEGNNEENKDAENEEGEEEKLYSETETERDSLEEYDDDDNDSRYSKQLLNMTQNTNQISYLRGPPKLFESKIDESGVRWFMRNKSQISNYSNQTGDQERMIVFNQQFFEENKDDINATFDLLNFSQIKETKDKESQQDIPIINQIENAIVSNRNKSQPINNRKESNQIKSRNNSNQNNIQIISSFSSNNNFSSRSGSNQINRLSNLLPDFSLEAKQDREIESK